MEATTVECFWRGSSNEVISGDHRPYSEDYGRYKCEVIEGLEDVYVVVILISIVLNLGMIINHCFFSWQVMSSGYPSADVAQKSMACFL